LVFILVVFLFQAFIFSLTICTVLFIFQCILFYHYGSVSDHFGPSVLINLDLDLNISPVAVVGRLMIRDVNFHEIFSA